MSCFMSSVKLYTSFTWFHSWKNYSIQVERRAAWSLLPSSDFCQDLYQHFSQLNVHFLMTLNTNDWQLSGTILAWTLLNKETFFVTTSKYLIAYLYCQQINKVGCLFLEVQHKSCSKNPVWVAWTSSDFSEELKHLRNIKTNSSRSQKWSRGWNVLSVVFLSEIQEEGLIRSMN